MKVSELVKAGIDFLIENGDKDVKIDLLTENQSNFIDEHHRISLYTHKGDFEIEIDVDSKKELIKRIK